MGIEQAWLIPAFGVLTFVVLALFRGYLPYQGKHLSVLAVIAGFVVFWPVLFDFVSLGVGEYRVEREWFTAGGLAVGWGTIIDPLTIVMLALVTFVSVIVQVYSLGYMRHNGRDDPRIGWYFAVHSLFTAAMLTLVLADNLLLLYVGWELVGLCSYLLIGFWYERQTASNAAKKAFITTRIGDVGLLIGILLLVAEFGTFDIGTILGSLGDPGVNSTVVTASAFLIFLGAMGKSAQFPLHVWLPDAMEGPTPVSALIHAATMVTAGVFLVARLLPLYEASYSAQMAVASVGLFTALMGASLALVVTDLKRILAYSTMSHLGFMMLALGALGPAAAIFHLLMHGVAKAMLFLSAGSIMHSMHDETDIRKMGGLRHRMPITTTAFTIGALALAGIAPLSAFWSKDEILLVVADGLPPIFVIGFLVAAFMSALYMARAIHVVFFGPATAATKDVHESPPIMSWPLALLAALTVFIGVIALPLGGGYDGIASFMAAGHGYEFDFVWSPIGILLAFTGLALGLWLYASARERVDSLNERYAWLNNLISQRYYMDHLYQWTVDRVVLGAGFIVAWFDRRGVNDIGVNWPGIGVLQVGKRVRYHITGLFADYGLGMIAGVLALGLFLWVRA
jgi:NADH-quinone oxidoreductase subunit L